MLDLAEIAPETPRALRREEYAMLVDAGCFEDEDVELLYGFVVPMSPHGAPHDGGIQALSAQLVRSLGDRASVRVQSALVLGDSQPEPDVCVVPPGDYRRAHPTTAWLVVEVAESSLRKDRTVKARLYAEHGIAEYWIVDIANACVHVHGDPKDGAYRAITRHAKGETVRFERFADVTVAVADLVL